MIEGRIDALTPEGILVDDNRARARNLAVGDTVDFGFVNGTTRTLTVEGIYSKDELAGPYVVTHVLHEQTGVDQFDFSVYVVKAQGVSDATRRGPRSAPPALTIRMRNSRAAPSTSPARRRRSTRS